MEKLKSSLPNMMLSLVLICVVAAGALAGVYLLTKTTIAKQEADKQKAAVFSVLPNGGEGAVIKDTIETEKGLTVYRAYIDSTFIGAAVKTKAMGFGGNQEIMVGLDAEDVIVNYQILKHQETPGLGDHIADWFNDSTKVKSYLLGRKANGAFAVSKDGGDVDAITAATISSRAFLRAINEAYLALHEGEGVEATTSASQLQKEEVNAEAPAVEAATEQHPDSVAPAEHHCEGNCEGKCEHKCQGKCQGHCKHHCENQPVQETEVTK